MKARAAIIAILFVLSGSVMLHAQQHPMYSQYTVDKFLVNPAVAGANGISTVNFLSRQQYVGFKQAPRTFALTAQSRILEDSYIMRRLMLRKQGERKSRSGRVGVGASIYNDRNGIVNRTGIQGTYAYHINFGNAWQLSMGLSVLGFQYRIDDQDVPVAEPDDPLLANSRKSFFSTDASAGVFATNGDLYGGIALTDLLGSALKLNRDLYFDYRTQRKFTLLAGYQFSISNSLVLEPAVLVQGTITSFSIDLNARLFYMENYWAGISYRSNNSMVMMLGGRLDRFYLGYAFDLDIGPVRTYTSGSHEVVFGIRIGDNDTRRFRWFRQDERKFDI
jgi:type IX secretion system PorP/SprF family membrane protein